MTTLDQEYLNPTLNYDLPKVRLAFCSFFRRKADESKEIRDKLFSVKIVGERTLYRVIARDMNKAIKRKIDHRIRDEFYRLTNTSEVDVKNYMNSKTFHELCKVHLSEDIKIHSDILQPHSNPSTDSNITFDLVLQMDELSLEFVISTLVSLMKESDIKTLKITGIRRGSVIATVNIDRSDLGNLYQTRRNRNFELGSYDQNFSLQHIKKLDRFHFNLPIPIVISASDFNTPSKDIFKSWNLMLRSSKVNLSGKDLVSVYLNDILLPEKDLSEANLSGASLFGANLSEADLYGAELSGANLSEADLSGARLVRTNLTRARLRGAKLSYSNLTNADLTGADLKGADLSNSDLSGSKLSNTAVTKERATQFNVRYDSNTIWGTLDPPPHNDTHYKSA